MKKKTYKDIKDIVESKSNCKLITLENEYKNTHSKIMLKCNCGEIFETTFHIFITKNKLQCNKCSFNNSSNKQKMNSEIVFNLFIENNYKPEFQLNEYKNAKQRLPYVCNNHKEHGIQYISYDNLKQGKKCKYCNIDNNRDKLKNEHKQIVENRDFIYIDTLFEDKTYIKFKCKIHDNEEQIVLLGNFKSQKYSCKYCNYESVGNRKRNDINIVIDTFTNRDYTYLSNNIYINNQSNLNYICNEHSDKGIQTTNYANIKQAKTCIYCINENISGENHYNYKGGISPLNSYLRYKINTWKRDSFKKYGYKCYLTNKTNNLIIHHLYGFNEILFETLNELKLPIHNEINLYSDFELNNIEKLFLEKHYKYGFGIPLNKQVHDLFHCLYGKGSNNCKQFEEFKIRYRLGEFSNYLNK